MSKKHVQLIPDHYFHIYNKAVSNNLLFNEDLNYNFFISKIQKYVMDSADILAYCLMPNHYHLIVQIKNDGLPASMHKLALSYAVSYNISNDRKGHLFSGPYQRKHINDLSYLLHLSRYIHLNPVKANLAEKAEDWNYSSYQEYLGIRKPEFINISIILDLMSEGNASSKTEQRLDYREFVEDWDFEYMSFKMK